LVASSSDANETSNENHRILCRSEIYEPHKLVPLLYTGLCKAIKENQSYYGQRTKQIYKLEMGNSYLFQNALRTGSKKQYSWEALEFTVGSKVSSKMIGKPVKDNDYFIIGILGYGSTSSVYQAIDSNGMVVAIKMYVKPVEDVSANSISGQEFNEVAVATMTQELLNFQNLYGAMLKDKVRIVYLFDYLCCLVMPFFEPVQKDDRTEKLKGIESVLANCFTAQNLKYHDDDICWRHVGIYQYFNVDSNKKQHVSNEIILYDLASLQTIPAEDCDGMVSHHLSILEKRSGYEKVSTPEREFIKTLVSQKEEKEQHIDTHLPY
jgi:Family of unknown function (DUF5898)